jgi:transposase
MSGTQTPPIALANPPLPDDLAVCQQMIRELLASLREQRQDNEQLRARIDRLLRRLYGPRAEHFDPNQPLLFADLNTPAEATPTAPTLAPPAPEADQKTKRKGHGRKQLPSHLRRERIEYTLTEAERICPCCGKLRHEIGTDVTEQLDYQPASLFVVEHVQHAYACAACQGEVIRADKLPQPIPKGLPGPGLLAYVVVSKQADHLPLYRLEQILARQGVDLTRSTLGAWMAQAADLLQPLYAEMVRRVLRTLVVHTDDTVVPVLDPEREHTRQGRLWLYMGDWMNPFNVFDYTPDRTQTGPQKFLKDFRGYLHADAYSGYDRVYKNQDVLEVACNAHARRKFYEARDNDPQRAHQALAYYWQLYEVEDQIRLAEAEARERGPMTETEAALFRVWWEEQVVLYRQEYALPIWLQFHAWLLAQKDQVLPKSPLGEALGYALNQYQALTEYLRQGFLAIDNNWAEREMKRVAIGRKNWLFAGSDSGGQTAAVLYSFISTCQRHGLDPFVYLRDVFRRLPTLLAEQLAELLPDRWQPLPHSLPPPSPGPPSEAATPAPVSAP